MALTKVTGSVIKDSVSLSGNVSVGGTLTYQDVTNVDALGIGTFRAGIDITGGNLIIPDKIIHSGDENTSIRFPSADTIRLETGGATRLTLDSNGNTLVSGVCYPQNGIRVPDDTYSYFGTGNDLSIRHDAAGGNHSYIFHHGTGAFKLASDTQMILGETTNRNYIQMNPNSDVKLFYDNAEKFATSPNGINVSGITTSGAGFMFGTDGEMYLYKSAANTATLRITSDGPYAEFKDVSGDVQIGSASGTLRLSAGGTERLRISSAGQLIMTNAATQTFFDFSTTNNNTRGLFSVAGKDNSGNAVTVKIGGFGDTNRGEVFTQSNHSLGFATNNSAAQVILHTSGLFDVLGECRATNFYLRGNGSAPTADASIFRPADNSLAFATASTERIRIENSGISGTIKNNYTLVALVTDRDDGNRSTGATSYTDDTGLNLTNAINYRHGDIFIVRVLVPVGIALVSTDTTNYQGVFVRIKITPSSGTTRYSADTKGWYRHDGRATKETMQLVTCFYHLTSSNTSEFNDNVNLSFQVQYHRDAGGAGSYGATGLSVWSGERTMEVWQFRKQL